MLSECANCKNEIDTNVCWCGEELETHYDETHQFIPSGCTCFYAAPPNLGVNPTAQLAPGNQQ